MMTFYLDTVRQEWHLRRLQGVKDYVHPPRAVCTHDLTDCSFAHKYDATRGRLCPGCKAAQGWTWKDPLFNAIDQGPIDEGLPVDSALTTVCTSNEDGFARIVQLYARPGQTIIDPTYGNGRFWRNVNVANYDARLSDLSTSKVDLRALPHGDQSADMVVLDPPYRYTPAKNVAQDETLGHGKVDGLYNLRDAKLTNTQAVIDLYVAGFSEAHRVLRVGGFLVVKCQDTVQDGKNIWVHAILMARAEVLGFACRDLLVVTPSSVLATRWERQRHLRKAHSYFLVFRKGGHFPLGMPSSERRNRSNTIP